MKNFRELVWGFILFPINAAIIEIIFPGGGGIIGVYGFSLFLTLLEMKIFEELFFRNKVTLLKPHISH